MNAPLKRAEHLRLRDGDLCWLCNYPIAFDAEPNSPKSPTVEHLEPKALGGADALPNLVLCHQHCNAHLRDHPKAKKLRTRAKWHAAYAMQQARRVQAPKAPIQRPAPGSMALPHFDPWRRIAIGTALLAAFACGLSAGLLIGG